MFVSRRRLRHAVFAMPKEMLPIVNKPLIQYGVEEALDAGMTGMAIVTGPVFRAPMVQLTLGRSARHRAAKKDLNCSRISLPIFRSKPGTGWRIARIRR